MKISSTKERPQEPVDLKDIYQKYTEQYDHVFIEDFGESGVFIFRTLGRKDFRDLLDTDSINNYLKEEVVCETCTLYPQNYDFGNCEEAGLPTQLCKSIIDKSLLKESSQLEKAIHYCRDKLANDLNEQITCVIHEAFPEFTIEEIANWDVIRTAEYMTRSEYVLSNLRGVPIVPVQTVPQEQLPEDQDTVNEARAPIRTKESPKINSSKNSPKDSKRNLTPEKLADLERRFPQINWRNDSIKQKGIKALQGQYFDTAAIAQQSPEDLIATQEDLPLAVRDKFRVIGEKKISELEVPAE